MRELLDLLSSGAHLATSTVVKILAVGMALFAAISLVETVARRLDLVQPGFFVLAFGVGTLLLGWVLGRLGYRDLAKVFKIGATVSLIYILVDASTSRFFPGLRHYSSVTIGRVNAWFDHQADAKDTPHETPCMKPYLIGIQGKPACWVDLNAKPIIKCYDRAGISPETGEALVAATPNIGELIELQKAAHTQLVAVATPIPTPDPTPKQWQGFPSPEFAAGVIARQSGRIEHIEPEPTPEHVEARSNGCPGEEVDDDICEHWSQHRYPGKLGVASR